MIGVVARKAPSVVHSSTKILEISLVIKILYMWSHFSGQKENLLLDDNITTNLEHWIVRGPRHPHERSFETLIRQARGGKGGEPAKA